VSRRSDDGDWKANVIPGHRATPRSIKVLLGVTAFVIQTALGLILTENLSLFLNRLTLTVAGATALVVPLLLWIAMDLGARDRETATEGAGRPARAVGRGEAADSSTTTRGGTDRLPTVTAGAKPK
jgi:hypothetical protein